MTVGVLDLLLITMVFRKILRQLKACALYFSFIQQMITFTGDTHMTSTLRGGGGLRHKWDVTWRRGVGVNNCSGRPIFFFLLNKIGFAPWPDIMQNINILYSQEIFLLPLMSDSQAILQWYHCIACELNRTIARVVNLDVMWLGFIFVLFLFVHMHSTITVP